MSEHVKEIGAAEFGREVTEAGVPVVLDFYSTECPPCAATPVPGLFVAGDLRAKPFRQITTAVADGTIAALAAQRHLKALAR